MSARAEDRRDPDVPVRLRPLIPVTDVVRALAIGHRRCMRLLEDLGVRVMHGGRFLYVTALDLEVRAPALWDTLKALGILESDAK